MNDTNKQGMPEIIKRVCESDLSGSDKEVLSNCYKITSFSHIATTTENLDKRKVAETALTRCLADHADYLAEG